MDNRTLNLVGLRMQNASAVMIIVFVILHLTGVITAMQYVASYFVLAAIIVVGWLLVRKSKKATPASYL